MPGNLLIGRDLRLQLLAAARSALSDWLEAGGLPPRPGRRAGSAVPAEHSGVFVTLTRAGRLRGCVGSLDPGVPLEEAVPSCAVMAATDSRFEPLALAELTETLIEISVLGPWRAVRGPSEVRLGDDGLVVSAGACRGLLLPRVALDRGWDQERFLEETCRKAGLPPESWRLEGAEIHAFQAEVFGEEEPGAMASPPGRRC